VTELFDRIERYYDAVPRRFARVEESGPLTLFLGEPGGWIYCARPRLGLADDGDAVDAVDVATALARLRELGLPETVEWVQETTPSLLGAVRDEGSLTVEELPLLVLPDDATRDSPTQLPDDVRVRVLGPDDDDTVAASRAVSEVGFAAPGTDTGGAGPAERDARLRSPQRRVMDLLAEGAVRIAVAEHPRDGVLAVGRTLPVDGVTEVMGVATLPGARRRGLGAAVTDALVSDAREQGVDLVFLTASSAAVARVYERVGFRRGGTGYAAEAG
jgi:ribosomal protein S18 acetylase RimI-like enzyme